MVKRHQDQTPKGASNGLNCLCIIRALLIVLASMKHLNLHMSMFPIMLRVPAYAHLGVKDMIFSAWDALILLPATFQHPSKRHKFELENLSLRIWFFQVLKST